MHKEECFLLGVAGGFCFELDHQGGQEEKEEQSGTREHFGSKAGKGSQHGQSEIRGRWGGKVDEAGQTGKKHLARKLMWTILGD